MTDLETKITDTQKELEKTEIHVQSRKERVIEKDGIVYKTYMSESQLVLITDLMKKDLSEPYSVYTYRYFVNNWPDLCWLAFSGDKCIGAIVCKQDNHKDKSVRGYIAMLAVDSDFRGRGIGSELVLRAVDVMKEHKCEEAVLETEVTNLGATRLYTNLGFIKDKFLSRYYMNGGDAWRLKLWLPYPDDPEGKSWLA